MKICRTCFVSLPILVSEPVLNSVAICQLFEHLQEYSGIFLCFSWYWLMKTCVGIWLFHKHWILINRVMKFPPMHDFWPTRLVCELNLLKVNIEFCSHLSIVFSKIDPGVIHRYFNKRQCRYLGFRNHIQKWIFSNWGLRRNFILIFTLWPAGHDHDKFW